MRTPEGRAPVVQGRGILRPRRAVVWSFERIRFLDRPPRRIERLLGGCRTNVAHETLFDRANFFDVLLSLEQRDLVLASAEGRPAELRQIILPQANETDVVRARPFIEDQVAAGGTGVAFSHGWRAASRDLGRVPPGARPAPVQRSRACQR